MVEFFWISLKKRWKTQTFTPKFTMYWPLAEKPRASVYFKAGCGARWAMGYTSASQRKFNARIRFSDPKRWQVLHPPCWCMTRG